MTGITHFFEADRLVSASGGADGGIVSFYYTGTTNLAPIYADMDLAVPLANPVPVAVGQILPRIYLDPSITYRRRIVHTSDGSVSDADPWMQDIRTELSSSSPGKGASLVVLRQGGTVQDAIQYVTPEMFGAVGDGIANDRAAVQEAITQAVTQDVPIVFFKKYLIHYTSAEEVISLPDGLSMDWLGGEVIWDTFGLPAFYNLSNFDFIRSTGSMRFRWNGTIPAGPAPAISTTFVTNLYNAGLTGSFNNCRDNVGALLLCGTNFRHEGSASFVCTDFSSVDKAVPLGFSALQGIGGARGRVVFTGSLVFDGILMGIQAFNVERFSSGDIYSLRWGQLDLDTYPHSIPGHVFYFAPDANMIDEVSLGNCFDAGIAMPGTDYSWGSSSYKTSGHPLTLVTGDLVSRRPAGLANIHCGSGSIGVMRWSGATTWAEYSANRAFTLGGGGTTGLQAAENVTIKGLFIDLPADDLGGVSISGTNITIQDGRWSCPRAGYGSATLISVFGTGHRITLDFDIPNIPYNKYTIPVTFMPGSTNTFVTCTTNSADWKDFRFIENGGSADAGNNVLLTHLPSGSIRKIGDNFEHLTVYDTINVPLTGASVPNITSGLFPGQPVFPKGSLRKGVVSRVEAAITGSTGFQIGDGTTATLYADKTGTAVGTQTAPSDLGNLALGQTTADQNLTVTSKTSNFTGGSLRIRAVYEIVKAGVYNF